MVCKKDVVTWFKGLKSYKRTDVMCTLLNLCLPFELRFLGTCLEHLGKRDFHELRQSENEANNLSEINLPELQCLSSQQVRTKLAVYVSLLHSCNYACSNNIYKILTKNEDVHCILKNSSDDSVLDDLLLIYTLAINHPGFSFEQKLNLEKIFSQLQEEERRLNVQSQCASRNKGNYVAGNSQENLIDKPPPPIQGYQGCISHDDHLIGVTAAAGQCPPLPPHPHHFSGDGSTTISGYPIAFPFYIPPQESPISRNSSPNSGSPPPSRVKFPPPRVPHPQPNADQLRDSITKELPTFATSLHPFNHDQLSRMGDDELRDIGLNQSAVIQLRAILNRQTNGIGLLDSKKKIEPSTDIDQPNVMRRYPTEALAVYPSGVYSCYTIQRKYHTPIYQAPQQFDFRQMRIASDQSSSDESSPDTPPPLVEGGTAEERLVGGGEERRGGGRGRSRHHPPGRPAVPRARGPHPDSRQREVNGSGSGGEHAPAGGFFSPQGYIPQYVRSPYPGGGFPGGGAGFRLAYPPTFQQPNGEIVYTYQPPGFIPPGFTSIPQPTGVLTQPPAPPPPQPQVPPKPLQPPPLSCYNCGSQSHSAVDCPEPSIEEVTKQGQYRLDFAGGYQKPVTGVDQHVPADK